MRSIIHLLLAIACLAAMLTDAPSAQAQSGLPSSPKFGYGARLDIFGENYPYAISQAAAMQLDWLAIDFDWARQWPAGSQAPAFDALNQAMILAGHYKLSVVLSITNTPAWAQTANGPDPTLTAGLVVNLARLYPGVLMAVELFPQANMAQGWGATPNPQAYLNLLQIVTAHLQADRQSVAIVAGGLAPLPPNSSPGDVDDLAFLDALYAAGAAPAMPIVSIRLSELTGEPMADPTPTEQRVLRHYEEIRQIMLNHDHRQGLIWITALSWPKGSLQAADIIYADAAQQAHWLGQAYQLLVAQLYLGAAFYERLNPPLDGDPTKASLILSDQSLHPAFYRLSQIIAPGNAPNPTSPPASALKKFAQVRNFKPGL
jgi:hypothetical protein